MHQKLKLKGKGPLARFGSCAEDDLLQKLIVSVIGLSLIFAVAQPSGCSFRRVIIHRHRPGRRRLANGVPALRKYHTVDAHEVEDGAKKRLGIH